MSVFFYIRLTILVYSTDIVTSHHRLRARQVRKQQEVGGTILMPYGIIPWFLLINPACNRSLPVLCRVFFLCIYIVMPFSLVCSLDLTRGAVEVVDMNSFSSSSAKSISDTDLYESSLLPGLLSCRGHVVWATHITILPVSSSIAPVYIICSTYCPIIWIEYCLVWPKDFVESLDRSWWSLEWLKKIGSLACSSFMHHQLTLRMVVRSCRIDQAFVSVSRVDSNRSRQKTAWVDIWSKP